MDRQELAKTLKAFADPTRLAVFDAIVSGTRCNSQIAERLGLSLSLVSHHLHFLESAGLVHGEHVLRDARWICYTVNREALQRLGAALRDLLVVNRIDSRLPKCMSIEKADRPGRRVGADALYQSLH